ncbi:ExeA family protein [Pseudoalteromonas ruthenica]|uniref:ExeA family protein n=1 Tax=Pseudoalteromonas ruthenica TaxID=151081 RepID=UPI00110BDD01|nr:AAA family ATPase [Pseudoalteromonas ruthenica]TMO46989.1 AAA family ATPase [Pseudoalteromonas ruthenica]TMO52936.1 AAA family ATPase [Pseudoalteromonas ruthenica]
MYLSFFNLTEMPFSLTPNTQFYCALEPHNEALKVLLSALSMSEGFIKVTGEVGTGKTLICRKLINHLEDNYVVVYLPNPYLTPDELRWAVAAELGLELAPEQDQQTLSQSIEKRLLTLSQEGKKVVMIVDEAQCFSWEALEALRLLTNLETEQKKLLQVVLFGQPELDTKLANPQVRQLRQRIGFSYQLRPMTAAEVDYYINHRLRRAGAQSPLFSPRLNHHIAQACRGIPRLVNTVCHKALLLAYGEGQTELNKRYIRAAIADTEDCYAPTSMRRWWLFAVLSATVLGVVGIWLWRQVL